MTPKIEATRLHAIDDVNHRSRAAYQDEMQQTIIMVTSYRLERARKLQERYDYLASHPVDDQGQYMELSGRMQAVGDAAELLDIQLDLPR